MTGKQLKFQFALDEQSFARVKRALQELTTEAQKFSKAMQQSGGGLFSGANVGRPPSMAQTSGKNIAGGAGFKTNVGQAILGDVEAFQKLAKSGKAGMDAMTDAVRRGVREQTAEIDRLEKKLAVLQTRFAKDPRAAYSGAFRDNLMAQMLSRQGGINAGTENLAQLNAAGTSLGIAMPGGSMKPPGLGAAVSGGGGGLGSILGAAAMALPVAAGVKLASMAIDASQSITGAMGKGMAERGQMTSGMLRRARNADVSDQLVLSHIGSLSVDERRRLMAQALGPDALAKDTTGMLGSVLSGNLGQATTMAGENRQLGRMLSDVMETAAKDARFTEREGRGYEYLNDTRDQRIQSARVRGAGFYKQKVFNTQTGQFEDEWVNTGQQTTESLMRRGFSNPDLDAATIQERQLGGGLGRGAADAMMRANAVGWGQYGQTMASSFRTGGTRDLSLGGGISSAAGLALNQAVLGQGWNPRGTTSGNAILGAVQGPGFALQGNAADMNTVQSIAAAMALGTNITTGATSPYQAGRNILSAIQANPGGSTYAQDYLGTGMDLTQLMDAGRGNLSKTAQALGITPEMARKQLGGSMGSMLDSWVDQGSNDTLSKAMRGYRGSGKSIQEYLKGLYSSKRGAEGDAIGAYYGIASGEGGEAGMALAGLLGGYDNVGKPGKLKTGGLDDETKAKFEELAKQSAKANEEALKVVEKVNTFYGENGGFQQIIQDFAELKTSIDTVKAAFYKLAGVTPEVEKAIEESGITGTAGGIKRRIANPQKAETPGVGNSGKGRN
jgi:hypothetical protein